MGILKTNGIPLAPNRDQLTCVTFLRNQAHAILAGVPLRRLTCTDGVFGTYNAGQRIENYAFVSHRGQVTRIIVKPTSLAWGFAPPVGLEPTTLRLTAECSAN